MQNAVDGIADRRRLHYVQHQRGPVLRRRGADDVEALAKADVEATGPDAAWPVLSTCDFF
jgi:hypothetical protein